MAAKGFRNFFRKIFSNLFRQKKEIKLGFYGPPNAGKCVTPETEVVLQNGQIRAIKDIFDEVKSKKGIRDKNYDEVYIDSSDSNIVIPSFDIEKLKIIPKKISYVYSQKYKGNILTIKTKAGRKIRVTPNHPLVRLSDKGVEYVRSGNLRIGECVGITKKIALNSTIEIPQATSLLRLQDGQVQAVSTFHKPKTINVPDYIDENLISFVAYTITESYHGNKSIVFSNTDQNMLKHFAIILKKLFGLGFIYRINKGVPQIEVYSKTLCDWLADTLDLKPGTAESKEIPSQLMGLPNNSTAILLKKLFDCEGYVPKNPRIRGAEIEFTSKSKKLVEQTQLLLNRFGIVGRFKEKEVKGQYYYRLLIGGSDNHRLFREHIGFDIKKKAQKLDILCSVGLKRNRFHLPIVNLLENIRKKSNLTQGQFFLDNKHVSRMKRDNRITYHRLTSMSKKHDNELISKLANSDTLWDEIIEIKTEKYDDYVYDLTVTDTHTFIVSNGLIAHNTSLANRICKDFTGEDMGKVSKIPHETRNVQFKERVEISYKGKNMTFKMIDTPGIATKIDYEDFLKYKVKKKDAKLRAKEATQGVIESIKWLDDMDVVVIVLDATQNPYNQVNITIIGNLVARNIPVLIVANKVDLKRSDIKKIEAAFPEYEVIGISAKYGDNLEEFYESIFKLSKKA
jgi:intein/homing endonuclease/GTPase SAR1 family protein